MGDTPSDRGEWRPPWQAKSLWLAAGLTLLGLVLWIATPRSGTPPPLPEAGTPLAQASGEAVASSVHTAQGTPALFRFGMSYIGGFFLGYGLKRFLKVTLVLSVAALGLLVVLSQTGVLGLDWSTIQDQARSSLGWLTGQAEALKDFLSGYLPSAGAAGVGLFLGLRWR
jgi:uncharacterized membrane protein (Fun14 family)